MLHITIVFCENAIVYIINSLLFWRVGWGVLCDLQDNSTTRELGIEAGPRQ